MRGSQNNVFGIRVSVSLFVSSLVYPGPPDDLHNNVRFTVDICAPRVGRAPVLHLPHLSTTGYSKKKKSGLNTWRQREKSRPLLGIEIQSSIPYPVITVTVSPWLIKTFLSKIEEENCVLEEFRKC